MRYKELLSFRPRHVQAARAPNYLRFTACAPPLILITTCCSNEYCFLSPKDLSHKFAPQKAKLITFVMCPLCYNFDVYFPLYANFHKQMTILLCKISKRINEGNLAIKMECINELLVVK